MPNRIEFPHFNEQKQVRLLSLTLTDDMRHALNVELGELHVSLNAHDALKLLEWLASYGEDIETLSQLLDQAAWNEDMSDQQRIRDEWRAYRNEGLGERG